MRAMIWLAVACLAGQSCDEPQPVEQPVDPCEAFKTYADVAQNLAAEVESQDPRREAMLSERLANLSACLASQLMEPPLQPPRAGSDLLMDIGMTYNDRGNEYETVAFEFLQLAETINEVDGKLDERFVASPQLRGRFYFEMGRRALDQEQVEDAIHYFETSLSAFAATWTQFALARAYHRNQDLDQALAAYTKVLEEETDPVILSHTHGALASIYAEQGKYRDQLAALEAWLALLAPDDLETRADLFVQEAVAVRMLSQLPGESLPGASDRMKSALTAAYCLTEHPEAQTLLIQFFDLPPAEISCEPGAP